MTSSNPSPARLSHDWWCLRWRVLRPPYAPLASRGCRPTLRSPAPARSCPPETSVGESQLRDEIRDRNTRGAHIVDTFRYQAKAFLPYGQSFTVGSHPQKRPTAQ